MKNRIHGLRGFTLVEVMISVSIFAVIMVAVNLVYLAGTRTYQQSTTMAQGRMITQKVVFEMEKDLVDCRVRDGSNLLDQLHFDKPTPRIRSGGNPDTDLRYFDASTLLPFWGDGETETDGSAELHVDNYIRYEFIQAAVLTEAADRRDYNRDGDMTDTFQRGRIVRSVRRPVDPSSPALEPSNVIGTPRNLSGDWVFRAPIPTGQPGVPGTFTSVALIASMDLDGIDGPDPSFLIVDDAGAPSPTGGRIQVRVFTMNVVNRTPLLMNSGALITPINR